MHTNDSNVQEKLWACNDLCLKEAMVIAKKVELSKRCMKAVVGVTGKKENLCNFGSSETKKSGEQIPHTSKSYHPESGGQDNQNSCYGCGRKDHFAKDKHSPAWKQKC